MTSKLLEGTPVNVFVNGIFVATGVVKLFSKHLGKYFVDKLEGRGFYGDGKKKYSSSTFYPEELEKRELC